MSERKYFPINESSARTAHNMMSMRDYAEGSTTAEYRSAVDKAYDLADKVAEKKPEEAERVYRLAERILVALAGNLYNGGFFNDYTPEDIINHCDAGMTELAAKALLLRKQRIDVNTIFD